MVAQSFEIIRYRGLVTNLVAKDLKVRYKNSVLGFVWSLLNPLLMTLVFTIVFTKLLGQTIEHFPVYVMSGLLAWNWTAASVTAGTQSLIENAPLINKVYFPRILLPVSTIASNFAHYLLAFPVIFIFMGIERMKFSPWLLYIPIIWIVQATFLVGLVLILASLFVYFRDTSVLVEVGITAWFFLTPIFYRVEDIAPDYEQIMYWVNPMASIIAETHTIVYYGGVPDPLFMARTFVQGFVLLVIGVLLFNRVSRSLGEYL